MRPGVRSIVVPLGCGVHVPCKQGRRCTQDAHRVTHRAILGRRFDEDLNAFTRHALGSRAASPWDAALHGRTASRLVGAEPAGAAEPRQPPEPPVRKDAEALEASAAVTAAAGAPGSRPALQAGEVQLEGPAARWRESAAQRDAVAPPRRQACESGPRQRSSLDRERLHDSQPAGRSYQDGLPHRGPGNSAPRVPRSALVSGAPYGELRSELVDTGLYPPVHAVREQRQPRPQVAVTEAAAPAVGATASLAAPELGLQLPVDDREDFEKELDAVVAELEKVCSTRCAVGATASNVRE